MSVIGKQNNTVKFSGVNRGFSAVPECSGVPGFSTCLTQQDGWETRDDRLTKKSRARLCIPGLALQFFVILPF